MFTSDLKFTQIYVKSMTGRIIYEIDDNLRLYRGHVQICGGQNWLVQLPILISLPALSACPCLYVIK